MKQTSKQFMGQKWCLKEINKFFYLNENVNKTKFVGHNKALLREKCIALNAYIRALLVAQWLRIHLPMEGTWVWALVREDLTCHSFNGELYPTRKEDITLTPHNFSQITKEEKHFPIHLWSQHYPDTKTRKEQYKKENYKSISLMNIDQKSSTTY